MTFFTARVDDFLFFSLHVSIIAMARTQHIDFKKRGKVTTSDFQLFSLAYISCRPSYRTLWHVTSSFFHLHIYTCSPSYRPLRRQERNMWLQKARERYCNMWLPAFFTCSCYVSPCNAMITGFPAVGDRALLPAVAPNPEQSFYLPVSHHRRLR